jgi:hypothetical protein
MAIVTTKTVLPGRYGTKRLQDKYGDKLLAVRYKLDMKRGKKIKTAEIIVDEWGLVEKSYSEKRAPMNKIVHLYVDFGEKGLGLLIRNAGGRWNKDKRYWELAYGKVLQLGLEGRILRRENV